MTTAKIRDAMRGAMWEEKGRGTLEEYRSPDMLLVGAKKWLDVPDPTPILPGSWPIYPIGYGTYGWKYDLGLIEESLACGPVLLDTAEGYGFGKVERELGKVLEKNKGDSWVASKVARNHMSGSALRSAVQRSRDKLQVSRIDLYQIHWPVANRLETAADAFADLLDQGVVSRVGVCNFCAGQLAWMQTLARERGYRIESNQIRCNAFDRSALEYLVPYCRRIGVKVIAYSPLAQGKSCSNVTGSLDWILSQGVNCVIPATNKMTHLRENLRGNEKRDPRI